MPVHATWRFARLTAAATVVFFAACAESGTDAEPISPQLMGMGNKGSVDCDASPVLGGTSPLTINAVEAGSGTPVQGVVAVFVHPTCGPIRFGQDGGPGDADGVANGTVVISNLSPTNGFVHVRDGVSLTTAQLDFNPPPLNTAPTDLDLANTPGHAATMTGPKGTSQPVTVANYNTALGSPPVRVKKNGTTVTLVMPTQTPIHVKLFNLDVPQTTLPVAAVLNFGGTGSCASYPWIDDSPLDPGDPTGPTLLELCESGRGVAYTTGLDIEGAGAAAFVQGDPNDPDCEIEVIGTGDASQQIIAAAAKCSDATNVGGVPTLQLFPRPALCQLPPMSGAGFIDDVRGTAKAIDYLNATFGATALNYPGIDVEGTQVPDLTEVAIYGDFVLLESPANGQFRSKETTTSGANSENLTFTVMEEDDGDVVCDFPDNPGNALIFCVSAAGSNVVKYSIVQSGLDANRTEFAFSLGEQGGDGIPDPDQGGGESFQVVPPPPAFCTFETDDSRFSVKF